MLKPQLILFYLSAISASCLVAATSTEFLGQPFNTPNAFLVKGLIITSKIAAVNNALFAVGTYQPDQSIKEISVLVTCGTSRTTYTPYRVYRSFEMLPSPADPSIASAKRHFNKPIRLFDTTTGEHCYVSALYPKCDKDLMRYFNRIVDTTELAKSILNQLIYAIRYMKAMGWSFHKNILTGACLNDKKDLFFISYHHTYSWSFREFDMEARELEIESVNNEFWRALAQYFLNTLSSYMDLTEAKSIVKKKFANLAVPPLELPSYQSSLRDLRVVSEPSLPPPYDHSS